MISVINVKICNVALHRVGNKLRDEKYVLSNSNYTDLTITVTGKVLNISFVNAGGTLTVFSGNKD